MIILITGDTHTGKTRLARQLMIQKQISCLSQDHIKMGLIRSGYTDLTPEDPDEVLTAYLWPVTREIIKTAIENHQELIIEGCYIPGNWKQDFDETYLAEIRYICLCFSESYIEKHYEDIRKYASCVEARVDEDYCTKELLLKGNARFRESCEKNGLPYCLITEDYEQTIAKITF